MTDNATAGDGSNSIKRDSKIGLIVQYVIGVALTFGAAELAKVDLSNRRGWWVPFAALALATGSGWFATYKAAREKRLAAKRGYEAY